MPTIRHVVHNSRIKQLASVLEYQHNDPNVMILKSTAPMIRPKVSRSGTDTENTYSSTYAIVHRKVIEHE
jgi:hypothetical protein